MAVAVSFGGSACGGFGIGSAVKVWCDVDWWGEVSWGKVWLGSFKANLSLQ